MTTADALTRTAPIGRKQIIENERSVNCSPSLQAESLTRLSLNEEALPPIPKVSLDTPPIVFHGNGEGRVSGGADGVASPHQPNQQALLLGCASLQHALPRLWVAVQALQQAGSRWCLGYCLST